MCKVFQCLATAHSVKEIVWIRQRVCFNVADCELSARILKNTRLAFIKKVNCMHFVAQHCQNCNQNSGANSHIKDYS